jgi:hypothetical protein
MKDTMISSCDTSSIGYLKVRHPVVFSNQNVRYMCTSNTTTFKLYVFHPEVFTKYIG